MRLGQKILALGVLYDKFLDLVNEIKKRIRKNSDCQKTIFVRFLYLKLDFCPKLIKCGVSLKYVAKFYIYQT